MGRYGFEWYNAATGHSYSCLTYVTSFTIPAGNPGRVVINLPAEFTKKQKSFKWTVAARGYYYNTAGNFFVFHLHAQGMRHWVENGIIKCEIEGFCRIQNGEKEIFEKPRKQRKYKTL